MNDKENHGAVLLEKGSLIKAYRIDLRMASGALVIDGTSSLDVSGTSRDIKGTYPGQGASYIGQGGHCTGTYHSVTYGHFDQQFEREGTGSTAPSSAWLLGSVGMNTTSALKHLTGGGGSIHIEADSIYFKKGTNKDEGKQIRANGYPTLE